MVLISAVCHSRRFRSRSSAAPRRSTSTTSRRKPSRKILRPKPTSTVRFSTFRKGKAANFISNTPCPTITYRVGGVILRMVILWIHKRTQMLIRYTLVDAHSDTTLRLRPFLAFRNKHELSKANVYANVRSYPVTNG
ncbi:MAG: glycogen debranching enzyme N-terminal domain-containing protein, partial [Thermoguttaceae bacterium]|nr:glycogen debranching enzyme N-terminal domain-containing protein [Thermoguttaceae bacterium]